MSNIMPFLRLTLINIRREVSLYCDHCSATGQARAYSEYELENDVYDCIEALHNATNILSKIGAGML